MITTLFVVTLMCIVRNRSLAELIDNDIAQVLSGDGRRKVQVNFTKGLTEEQVKTMTKDMDGLKIKYIMPTKEGEPPHKRIFKVNGLKKGANKEIIRGRSGEGIMYFRLTSSI